MATQTIDQLVAKLTRKLPQLAPDTARRAAPKLKKVIAAHWDAGKGPDGRTWARLATGKPSFLQKTRNMRRSLSVRAVNLAILWSIAWPSILHQYGTSRMPARPLFPGRNLPPAYAAAVKEAYREALAASLK